MRWPWSRKPRDRRELEEAEQRASDLEERTENVARRVRESDPWAGRVLDAIHQSRGEPHAHL